MIIMSEQHPIGGLLGITLEKIKDMVDVNTIIGDPVTTPDGTVIIPVSKVSYGFASGGSDFPTKKESKDCFGGGSGAGITISPVAFLVVGGGDVKLINIESYDGATDRVVALVPEVIDKVASLFKKNGKKSTSKDVSPEIVIDDPIV